MVGSGGLLQPCRVKGIGRSDQAAGEGDGRLPRRAGTPVGGLQPRRRRASPPEASARPSRPGRAVPSRCRAGGPTRWGPSSTPRPGRPATGERWIPVDRAGRRPHDARRQPRATRCRSPRRRRAMAYDGRGRLQDVAGAARRAPDPAGPHRRTPSRVHSTRSEPKPQRASRSRGRRPADQPGRRSASTAPGSSLTTS